jgi:hypothetical protein
VKKSNGKFSPKVVALLEELKKDHPPRIKRVFTESCWNITARLGKAFAYDPENKASDRAMAEQTLPSGHY